MILAALFSTALYFLPNAYGVALYLGAAITLNHCTLKWVRRTKPKAEDPPPAPSPRATAYEEQFKHNWNTAVDTRPGGVTHFNPIIYYPLYPAIHMSREERKDRCNATYLAAGTTIEGKKRPYREVRDEWEVTNNSDLLAGFEGRARVYFKGIIGASHAAGGKR